jgi:hypothetical protein
MSMPNLSCRRSISGCGELWRTVSTGVGTGTGINNNKRGKVHGPSCELVRVTPVMSYFLTEWIAQATILSRTEWSLKEMTRTVDCDR